MSAFAANTGVSVEKSRAEVERLLARYGATRFASGWDEHGASIMFEAKGRRVKFVLPLPARSDKKFERDGRGKKRNAAAIEQAHEQACRQRWRALTLVIKAKLEAVESGITGFENEFLAHIVLPSGDTVGDWAGPQLEHAYSNGRMPSSFLLGAKSQ
jgi:hypothetical protein